MTVDRGCTVPEAHTAKRLASVLAAKWGFGDADLRPFRDDFYARYAAAEKRAAGRFAWEYRRCGKRACHCMRTAGPGHGPYKYGKRRDGKTVRSIYMGQ